MWVILLLFSSAFLEISCEKDRSTDKYFMRDGNQITVPLQPGGDCSALLPVYTFNEGSKVSVIIASKFYINHGWLRLVDPVNDRDTHSLLNLLSSRTMIANKSHAGTWEIEILFLRDLYDFNEEYMVEYQGYRYHQLKCRFSVDIAPPLQHKNISVLVKPGGDCSSLEPAYNFIAGSQVTVDIKNKFFINYGWLKQINSDGTNYPLMELKDPSNRMMIVNKSHQGTWEIKLLFLKNVIVDERYSMVTYNFDIYNQLLCRFNVTILD